MQTWHYEPAEDLNQPPLARLRRFPREPDMLVFAARSLAALALRGWLRLYHRLKVVGGYHLPASGSFVMVANHASHLDALCLLASLPLVKLHRAYPAAARDYFFVSGARAVLAAVVANALPFDRRAAPGHSLDVCKRLLAQPGNVLIVFPEGTRSATGALADFKPGVGLLLAGNDIPVVPCYLDGAFAAWPRGAWLPRPRPIRLTIGAPRRYAHLPPGKASAIQVCAELHDAVSSLRSVPPARVFGARFEGSEARMPQASRPAGTTPARASG